MKFEIVNSYRKRDLYRFTIKGEEEFGASDLVLYMSEISEKSKDYYISEDFVIHNRKYKRDKAQLYLKPTLSPNIKKLYVYDDGIGKQMIEKFVKSIEKI